MLFPGLDWSILRPVLSDPLPLLRGELLAVAVGAGALLYPALRADAPVRLLLGAQTINVIRQNPPTKVRKNHRERDQPHTVTKSEPKEASLWKITLQKRGNSHVDTGTLIPPLTRFLNILLCGKSVPVCGR
jgi:hypothetical protein